MTKAGLQEERGLWVGDTAQSSGASSGVLCWVTHGPHAVSPSLAQLIAVLLITVLLIAVVTRPGCGVSLPYMGLVGWFLFQVVLDINQTRHGFLEVLWL